VCYNRDIESTVLSTRKVKTMNVVFTGECSTYTRDQLKAICAQLGVQVNSSVTSKTDVVICSFLAAVDGTTKFCKAKEKGLPLMTYDDFLHSMTLAC